MVVQFGFAMMPFGGSPGRVHRKTTSGTSGSLRHAEELSTTVAPTAANRGACSFDSVPLAGEQGDVDALQILVRRRGDVLDHDVLAAVLDGLARRTSRREETDLVRREIPLGENAALTRANLFVAPTMAMVVM